MAVRYAWCINCADLVPMHEIENHQPRVHPDTWLTLGHHDPPLFASDADVESGQQLITMHHTAAEEAQRTAKPPTD